MIALPSPNFTERTLPVSMIVLHYTGMKTKEDALDRLCDPRAKVSAHYVVDEDGAVYALVDEIKRAHHAGVSFWKGITDINSASVGVEIVNKGHEFGYTPFPEKQIDAVVRLCADIMKRHDIRFVLGHSDVAPARKQDPGELFPWKRLAENGIGFWTDDFLPAGGPVERLLKEIGYDTTDLAAAQTAFCRHFLPEALTAPADVAGRAAAVLKGLS